MNLESSPTNAKTVYPRTQGDVIAELSTALHDPDEVITEHAYHDEAGEVGHIPPSVVVASQLILERTVNDEIAELHADHVSDARWDRFTQNH